MVCVFVQLQVIVLPCLQFHWLSHTLWFLRFNHNLKRSTTNFLEWGKFGFLLVCSFKCGCKLSFKKNPICINTKVQSANISKKNVLIPYSVPVSVLTDLSWGHLMHLSRLEIPEVPDSTRCLVMRRVSHTLPHPCVPPAACPLQLPEIRDMKEAWQKKGEWLLVVMVPHCVMVCLLSPQGAQPNGVSRPQPAFLAWVTDQDDVLFSLSPRTPTHHLSLPHSHRGGNPFATVRLRPTLTNDRSAPVIWSVHVSARLQVLPGLPPSSHPGRAALPCLLLTSSCLWSWMRPDRRRPALTQCGIPPPPPLPLLLQTLLWKYFGSVLFTDAYIFKIMSTCVLLCVVVISTWPHSCLHLRARRINPVKEKYFRRSCCLFIVKTQPLEILSVAIGQ